MGRYAIEIPRWSPHRDNQLVGRSGWVVSRRKRADYDMVATYAAIAGVPRAKGPRSVRWIVTRANNGGKPDPTAFDKSLLDALVRCGMLVGDRQGDYVKLEPEFIRGKEAATLIILEDLPCERTARPSSPPPAGPARPARRRSASPSSAPAATPTSGSSRRASRNGRSGGTGSRS
jgi:hypothetical protein